MEKLSGQIVLGFETFLNTLKDHLGEKVGIAEIPRIQRFASRPLLAECKVNQAISIM